MLCQEAGLTLISVVVETMRWLALLLPLSPIPSVALTDPSRAVKIMKLSTKGNENFGGSIQLQYIQISRDPPTIGSFGSKSQVPVGLGRRTAGMWH
jgi:hypothetical protein